MYLLACKHRLSVCLPVFHFFSRLALAASIGDLVWQDDNGDGIKDPSEAGIPGVTVTLQFPNATTISTVTDADGLYSFDGLLQGPYVVIVDPIPGMVQTYERDGNNDGLVLVIMDGVNNVDDVDFGFRPGLSIFACLRCSQTGSHLCFRGISFDYIDHDFPKFLDAIGYDVMVWATA